LRDLEKLGIERFYAANLALPGRYGVMVGAIYGSSLVSMGFSKHVAWSHTVSTGWLRVVRSVETRG